MTGGKQSEEIYMQRTPITYEEAKYHKASLVSCVPQHLSQDQGAQLLALLYDFEDLFEGKLGEMPGAPIHLQLKSDARPKYIRPFPIPCVHYDVMKVKVDRLEKIGVLRKILDTPWSSPSFPIPKPNGTIRFLTDL
jgi:hypothetical protein